jgi:ABC-2 type transport system permease protein
MFLSDRVSKHSCGLGSCAQPGPLPRQEITPVTIVAHELKASYAFIERNFFLTRRYWGWELAFLVYSVAGALSISLIGADQGSPTLLLTLMVGAIFWNYLSVVFSWIAETISVERWEGTLEYTMMAPIRRWSQLLGSVLYAMVYGLVHTTVILVALILFFPQLELSNAEPLTVVAFMLLGSFSFVGIGMMAAILPLLYVERGAQMTFVLQSCLLLVSGVYYSIEILPGWMQVLSHLSPATYVLHGVRAGLIDGAPVGALLGDVWPLIVMGTVLIPFGLWAFGRAERYAKRTGKLKRVG